MTTQLLLLLLLLAELCRGATTVRTPRKLDPVMERHFKIKTGQLNIPDSPLGERSVAPPVPRPKAWECNHGCTVGRNYTPTFRSDALDVVVGMVWGVDADTSRFVRSWLWHAPEVRMVLLVPPGQDFARKAYLQEWGVELRPWPPGYTTEYGELKRFDLYYDLMLELHEEASSRSATAARCTSSDTSAGSMISCPDAKLFGDNPSPYVLLSDVRDVIVQSNPFTVARERVPGKVVISLEDSRVTLGACPFNSQWILELYGEDVLEDMADRRISCSGVTLGPLAPMLRYVRTMRTLIGRIVEDNEGTKVIRKGSDQGIHNCVVHGFCHEDSDEGGDQARRVLQNDGTLGTDDNQETSIRFDAKKDVAFLPNEASVVQTLGWVPWENDLRSRIDLFGRVLDNTGRVVPLLHQFDRHTELYKVVLGMYPWWEPTMDIAEAKRREASRRKKRRKRGKKWKKRRRRRKEWKK